MFDVRYCILASSANLGYFPRNTLTNFTNIFPIGLRPTAGERRLYARLRSIAISPELRDPHNIDAGVIRVYINELRAHPSNSDFDKCLARFAFPSGHILQHYIVREFATTPFVPLAQSSFSTLSVLITDNAGEELLLADGFPTFVQLELSDMRDPRVFTMTCMSHLPDELAKNPNNSLGDFKVTLPGNIQLDDYEVALTGLIFPHDLRKPPVTEEVTINVLIVEDTVIGGRGESHLSHTWKLAEYENSDELREAIQADLNADGRFSHRAFCELVENEDALDYGMLKIGGKQSYVTITTTLSDTFLRIMPDARRVSVVSGETTQPLGTIIWQKDRLSHVGLVYADCIRESILGDHFYQLLQIVPIETENGKYVYEPDHLTYHPVTNREFNSIHFKITEPHGEVHDFVSQSRSSIIATLEFRPDQSQQQSPVTGGQPSPPGRGGGSENNSGSFGEIMHLDDGFSVRFPPPSDNRENGSVYSVSGVSNRQGMMIDYNRGRGYQDDYYDDASSVRSVDSRRSQGRRQEGRLPYMDN